jgi:peptidoglycan/LPS O-acetylase OafA/YrhL
MLRIWPLYFFFIALSLFLTNVDPSQHLDIRYVLGYILLSGNWVIAIYGAPQSVSGPLWTVSIEEQFYLLWPSVVRKASLRTIATIAWSLIAISLSARAILSARGVSPLFIWCSTITRLDPIAMGILFAVWIRQDYRSLKPVERLSLAVVGWLCWVWAAYSRGTVLEYTVVGFGSICMLYSAYDGPKAGLWLLENKTLTYLGKISYGIYVYHELCLLISRHVFGGYTKHASGYMMSWVSALCMTILFAALSYRFLESPFLRLKAKLSHVASRPV